ncbi:hypothetical protein J6590_064526 [Homalodisca vitripennis]|uniref:Uncharacterized protein n=1 Tax=Homalodisca liturata TaxID=320908 RepID=A0A1B6J1H6_9HEMI|nr:hypothetical protein J6590_064526 [Homalodisca vitripennis]
MKRFIFIVLCAAIMVLQPDSSSGSNIILGSFHGRSDGHFGAGASECHYTNNNGIEDHYKAFTTYEQRPDGSCVKRVVEDHNGREEVREYPMDCEKAKAEIRENSERTHRVLSQHHDKMMKEHRRATKRLQDEIKASFRNQFNF